MGLRGPGKSASRLLYDLRQHVVASGSLDELVEAVTTRPLADRHGHSWVLNESQPENTPQRRGVAAACELCFSSLRIEVCGQIYSRLYCVGKSTLPQDESYQFSTLLADGSCIVRLASPIIPGHLLDLAEPPSGEPHSPYSFFQTMSIFVGNELRGDFKAVAANREAVVSRLGHQYGPFMEFIGYTYYPDNCAWVPAKGLTAEETLRLQVVHLELQLRAAAYATLEENIKRKIAWNFVPLRADGQLARVFGLNALHSPFIGLEATEIPYFANLGITAEDSDNIVLEAFEQLTENNPTRHLHYLECLEYIAAMRASEELQIAVAKERSKQTWNKTDLAEAYEMLNLGPDAPDERVVAAFKSKSGSMYSDAMRVIGEARGSAIISQYGPISNMSPGEAYKLFHVSVDATDSSILNAFQTEISSRPEYEVALQTALRIVAVTRCSNELIRFIEEGENYCLSLNVAYNMLGIEDRSFKDDEIIDVFAFRVMDQPSAIMDLRAALRSIAASRESQKIKSFLLNGTRESLYDVQFEWPRGLENIGNTCYLNSLLQLYFTIKPLRESVMSFALSDPMEKVSSQIEQRIGGRKVSRPEIVRARSFVVELRLLFEEMVYSNELSIVPRRELVHLALVSPRDELNLSTLPTEEDEEHGLLSWSEEKGDENDLISLPESAICAEQQPQIHLDEPSSSPLIPSQAQPQVDSPLAFGKQQDVTESVANCFFQLESALQSRGVDEHGEQLDLIKDLFYGKTMQTLECAGSELRKKIEYFSSLFVDVASGSKTLYHALDDFFDASGVVLDGKEAKRFVTICEAPPILQIQVQRVQFDRQLQQVFKSNAYLKFPEIIYLDKYFETENPDILNKRRESWNWKSELRALKEKRQNLVGIDGNSVQVLKSLRSWLQEQHIASQVVQESLEVRIREQADLLSSLDQRIHEIEQRLETQFKHFTSQGYSIHAVLIHRGQATFGHYWIYIYDGKDAVWRKYNDNYVTIVERNEVFSEADANPYMLVYVRHGADHLVESMCRRKKADTGH